MGLRKLKDLDKNRLIACVVKDPRDDGSKTNYKMEKEGNEVCCIYFVVFSPCKKALLCPMILCKS